MQINALPGVRFLETFLWNSPCPAELLKTIKPFDAIYWGPVILDHRLLDHTMAAFVQSDAVERVTAAVAHCSMRATASQPVAVQPTLVSSN